MLARPIVAFTFLLGALPTSIDSPDKHGPPCEASECFDESADCFDFSATDVCVIVRRGTTVDQAVVPEEVDCPFCQF